MAESTEQTDSPSIGDQDFELFIRKKFFLERTIVYTSEKNGSDENGDGSEIKPFQTPLQVFVKRNFPIKFCLFDQAFRQYGENVTIYIDSKEETEVRFEYAFSYG